MKRVTFFVVMIVFQQEPERGWLERRKPRDNFEVVSAVLSSKGSQWGL